MNKLRIALLGFGTVGKGIYQTIEVQQARLQQLTGKQVEIAAIVVKSLKNHKNYNGHAKLTTDFQEVLGDKNIDLVMEAIVGKEPAFTYLQQSIQQGMHVVTANKEMFAQHGQELKKLAEKHCVQIGFEATTAGGIPVIATIRQLLQVNRVRKIQAILNGTSNYILTEMRMKQLSFSQALKKAQELGYAEANPANDIDGRDAYFKAVILCQLLFGSKADKARFKQTGIRDISMSFLDEQEAAGKRVKHLVTIAETEDGIYCDISPAALEPGHPLYAVEGVDNAVHLETDILGELTLTGPGAGALPTASAMIEDFCTIIGRPNAYSAHEELASIH
ncbi:homoserine dehydrogenase [Virgibacillus halophilus]|uniref:Homoserine dehydrogenase n=1 Tax=Tigheibacillus halophilus TaxID=361280 RepID=A0ABU5C6J9_9BACI|nr:homoserine dehydrogenase [Virgibacillus halophilus]